MSRWGNQIKNRRRRRKPEGRPETPPGAAVGDGCQPGASARRCCVCCAERISSPARAAQWRDQFLAAGQASLKSRAPDAWDEANRRLQAKIVSRELGITAARAAQWRDQFLAAGQASLKSRAPDAWDEANRRLQAKIGELLMENELLYAKVDQLEVGGPLARRRSRR